MFIVVNTTHDHDKHGQTTARALPKIYPTREAAVDAIRADADRTWKEHQDLIDGSFGGETPLNEEDRSYWLILDEDYLSEEWAIQEVTLA